jgi:integrase
MSKENQQINLELLAAYLNNMPDAEKKKLYTPVAAPKKKTRKGVSTKGRITKSNYIDFDKAYNTALRMKGTKNENFGFYIVVAICTGLRIGDILKLKRKNFEDGVYQLREQKTGKPKFLPFNEKVLQYFNELRNKSEIVFRSNKNTTYSNQQINTKIKQTFQAKNKNYSSHSLRKSFGRRVYEMNNRSEDALINLSEIYNHTSMRVTRTYLDITQEKLDSIYLGL